MNIHLAVIGAGPVGLALALRAARSLPASRITLYDALPAGHDVTADPRTLALSLGSVQMLAQLGVWAEVEPWAAPIRAVHVSQQQPGLAALAGLCPWLPERDPEVLIRAEEQRVAQLGAVATYGHIVAPLRAAWQAACAAEPARLQARYGRRVEELQSRLDHAEVRCSANEVERFDLAVVAEGGVFAEQARKALRRDYGQTAWIGVVELEGSPAGHAYERFTSQGPVALLPLPPEADTPPGRQRAALVWCVTSADDQVTTLDTRQRLCVLESIFAGRAGKLVGLSALKSFALGLNAERTLVQGRSVRIGNAAQTLHPVAGQGLNLGLRDSWELVRSLGHETDTDRALARMARQRAPDRWLTIAATDLLARGFTWPLPGLAGMRAAGLAAVQHLPGLRGLLARHMMYGQR